MSLVQMSVSGAVLILFIVVIRALMVNKLPKRTFTLLWTVALLRLLIPLSIPSTLSVYAWIGQSQSVREMAEEVPISMLLPISADSIQNHISSLGTTEQLSVWVIIWAAGAALCAAYYVTAYCSFFKGFQTSLLISNCFTERWLDSHRLRRRISVRLSDRISSPLSYGVVRPVILIPEKTDWENTEQLDFVFEHEYAHICRYDSVTKLILALCACVHWFNPAVWVMFILFNRDMELACDEAVIRKAGIQARSGYAMALIDMEEQRSDPVLLGNYFSKSSIEERIVAIMKHNCDRPFYRILSAALVLCVCVCFATSARADVADPPTDNTVHAADLPDIDWIWPANSDQLTLTFGTHTHPITGESYHSDHITIAENAGDPVYSAISGTVTAAGFDNVYGYYIVVSGVGQIRTVYGHLQNAEMAIGTQVAAGQQIGTVGTSGTVTGACLAFAVFIGEGAVDPLDYYT